MFRTHVRTAVQVVLRDGALILGLLVIVPVSAACAAGQDSSPDTVIDYQIVAQKLDEARNGMSPETGSSTYAFDQQAIQSLPQGDATPVNDVILQAPGVAQDSYGQLHIRGDHADLQYRINGIILPEGISGFGQTLDTHFADSINLLTGALPAQYGYRTAGIVNITTKSGALDTGASSSVTVGGNQTFEGNQSAYGSKGAFNYYVTATYDKDDRGIEPPTPGYSALHDFTRQDKEFGYLSYVFNAETRVSLLFGNATNHFQIPDNPGQPQQFMLAGTPVYPSAGLNENQLEHNTYGIVSLQGLIGDKTDYQLAFFTRTSSVQFTPDQQGDLIYNGIASQDDRQSFTNGVQNDFTYRLNEAHTVRSGWSASYESAISNSVSSVFSTTGPNCLLVACTPLSITDDHDKNATLFGTYLQDEWKAFDKLTINYGARFDYYDAFVRDEQLSPRIGDVYELTDTTKLHAGYARYFTPPPTELIAPFTLAAFAGTTGEPAVTADSPVRPEKDNYYDAGVIQKIGDHATFGVDAYDKEARNLLDEGQFGQALIFAPFNYDKGYVRGVEFTGDYRNGPFSGYANLAVSRAMGKGVESGQFNFDAAELAYINSTYVHLDHDQTFSGSAGASYTYGAVKYSSDLIYGSGLRNGFANTTHLPFYMQVNAALEHSFDLGHGGAFDGKFSVINVFDKVYEIRDGTGIGVFAPQYGPRRTALFTLSKSF